MTIKNEKKTNGEYIFENKDTGSKYILVK